MSFLTIDELIQRKQTVIFSIESLRHCMIMYISLFETATLISWLYKYVDYMLTLHNSINYLVPTYYYLIFLTENVFCQTPQMALISYFFFNAL